MSNEEHSKSKELSKKEMKEIKAGKIPTAPAQGGQPNPPVDPANAQ